MVRVKIPGAGDFGRRPSVRPQRVADAIQRELALLFLGAVKDPRLHGLTVTAVEVSRDLRHAHVHYSCTETEAAGVVVALGRAGGYIRSHLARELGMRYVPELHFHRDLSLERQAEIERLLSS